MTPPEQAVRLPALGVIATGIFWLLLWIAGAVNSIWLLATGTVPTDPETTPPALNLVAQIVFAAVAVVVIVGGVHMRRLRHRTLSVIAAVLSLLCGCLPLAVWAIIVLFRPEVAAAFDQPAPPTAPPPTP